jgi:N-acetylglutamate synthase
VTPGRIDVESLERATVDAVSPEARAELPGWLLPFDAGTVGRAKSAVPLRHDVPAPDVLQQIEAMYAQRGLPVMLRTPMLPAFDSFHSQLRAGRYIEEIVTEVQVAQTASVHALSAGEPALLLTAPDADWASVFLGEGFDPVDGASRVRKLGQGKGSLFALVREDGRPVAAGAAAFSHGWSSVHGMRTAQDCRGRGLAARVLATLAGAAIERGFEQMFLQVSNENAAAQSLYRRAGFDKAWTYSYWRQPRHPG